jgi:hypothetical protein
MVPYRYQHNRNAVPEATPPRETLQDDRGVGDITAAIYHQLSGRHWGSALVAGLQLKSTTGRDIFETIHLVTIDDETQVVQDGLPMGTGFWSAKAVLAGVRISDPAALFWNLGYTRSLPRDHVTVYRTDPTTETPAGEQVKVSPGATFEYGFGLGYALNPDLSLNLQFQQSFTQSTRISGAEAAGWVAGSTVNAAILRLGAVWSTSAHSSTELSVSNGLTADSPDFVVELRKVYSY